MKYEEPKKKPEKQNAELEFEVKCTTNYDSFKIVQANREIDKAHVHNLVQSIKKKNMMAINPVLVSDDMEVIDGQHRIEACRILGEKVWYVKASGLDHFDILALNNVKKVWDDMDYFNFFLIKKYTGFKEVNDVMIKYRVKLKVALMLCSEDGKPRTRDIKEGKIYLGDISRVDTVMKVYEAFYGIWPLGTNFLFALRKIMCGDVKQKDRKGNDIEFDGTFVSAFVLVNSLNLEEIQEEFKFKYGDNSFMVISDMYWIIFLGRLQDAILNGFSSELGFFGCDGYLNDKKLVIEKQD